MVYIKILVLIIWFHAKVGLALSGGGSRLKCVKCRREIPSDPVFYKAKSYLQWVVLDDGGAYCLRCAAESTGLDVGELLSKKGVEVNVGLARKAASVGGVGAPAGGQVGGLEGGGEPFPLGRGLKALDGVTVFKGKIGRWFYWLAVVAVEYEGNGKRSIRVYRWRRRDAAQRWRVDNKLTINTLERFGEIVDAVKRLSPLLGGGGGGLEGPSEDSGGPSGGSAGGGGVGGSAGGSQAGAGGRTVDSLIDEFLERGRGG